MSTTKVTGMMQTSTKGGDITSASPCVIDTDGDYFNIAGTVSFAVFTVVAGRRFAVQFDGILTMTHHATTLDLPGGANITTAAGDVAEFFATGTNTVQCVNYTRASGAAIKIADESIDSDAYVDGSIDAVHLSANSVDSDSYVDASIDNAHLADDAVGVAELSATGTASSSTFLRGDNAWAAAGGGSLKLVGTSVASDSASLTITGIDATYEAYLIIGSDLVQATQDSQLYLRVGDSGGIDSGASDYLYISQTFATASYACQFDSTASHIKMAGGPDEAATHATGFHCWLYYPGSSSSYARMCGSCVMASPSGFRPGYFFGFRNAAISLDRVQFLTSSGNITSGRLSVYGFADS